MLHQGVGGASKIGGAAGIGGGASAGVSWSVIQSPHNFTCTASIGVTTITCTVTVTSTVAGDGLILGSAIFGAAGLISSTSASGDSAWTHCPNALAINAGGSGSATDCWYIASATGSATSLTFTWNFSSGVTNTLGVDVKATEVRRSTGSPTIDSAGTTNNTTSASCATCTGPALTLTGTDFVTQFGAFNAATIPSSLSGYTAFPIDCESTNVGACFAGAVNLTSAPAVSWIQSPADRAAMSAAAFK
jgi:hypothetical protein